MANWQIQDITPEAWIKTQRSVVGKAA